MKQDKMVEFTDIIGQWYKRFRWLRLRNEWGRWRLPRKAPKRTWEWESGVRSTCWITSIERPDQRLLHIGTGRCIAANHKYAREDGNIWVEKKTGIEWKGT